MSPVFLLLCEKWSATMSTIEEVRAAEKKLQVLVNALRKAGANDPDNLNTLVMNASQEYARAVRELEPQRAHPGAQNRAA